MAEAAAASAILVSQVRSSAKIARQPRLNIKIEPADCAAPWPARAATICVRQARLGKSWS